MQTVHQVDSLWLMTLNVLFFCAPIICNLVQGGHIPIESAHACAPADMDLSIEFVLRKISHEVMELR